MVNEKQATTRPSILGVLVGKFFMNVMKSPGLLASCLFPAAFLLVCRLIIFGPLGPDDTLVFLLTFGMLFSSGMIPSTTIIYPMSEACEKHTLRTMSLAGVGRNQMIAAHGIVGTLYTALVGGACFLITGASIDCMLPFMLITVLASIPLIVLSLVFGLLSRSQTAAMFFSLPGTIIGILPALLSFTATTFGALPLLPTGGGFALIYALVEGTLFTSASILPAIAQLVWIVVSVIAFIVVTPRITYNE